MYSTYTTITDLFEFRILVTRKQRYISMIKKKKKFTKATNTKKKINKKPY